jgi:hypothetical protein
LRNNSNLQKKKSQNGIINVVSQWHTHDDVNTQVKTHHSPCLAKERSELGMAKMETTMTHHAGLAI